MDEAELIDLRPPWSRSPVLMSCIGIDPMVETILRTIDSSDISRLMNRVGILESMAAALAIAMAMAVFPMLGLAPIIASSPNWKPSVI